MINQHRQGRETRGDEKGRGGTRIEGAEGGESRMMKRG